MIMKLIKKKVLIPICILFLTILTFITLLSNPLSSSAAGTVDIFMDSSSWVPVGNTFVLTVRVETDIAAMVNLEISYNGDNLECIGAYAPNDSGAYCNDNGSLIMIVTSSLKTSHKYECTFKVKKEAATALKASVIECGTLDAIELPTPSLEKTITGYVPTPTPTQAPTPTPTVAPTNVPTATQTPTQTQRPTPTQTPSYTPFNPTINPSATPSNPNEFSDNGEIRYIADDFEENSVAMPEGFEKRSLKYMGANIFGAQNSSGVTLIYTTDVLGQNGKFYIYIEKQDTLLPYLEIPFGNNSYVFTKFAETPSSLHEKDFDLAENKVPAYTTIKGIYKDFIILYGFKVGGELSYYLYDTVEGTLQRCVDSSILNGHHEDWNGENNNNNIQTNPPSQTPAINTIEPTATPTFNEKGTYKIDKNTIIFAIIIVCIIAVILAIIIITIRGKKIYNRYNDDEFYNEDQFIPTQPSPVDEDNYLEEETHTEEAQDNCSDDSVGNKDINIPHIDDDDDEILQLGND